MRKESHEVKMSCEPARDPVVCNQSGTDAPLLVKTPDVVTGGAAKNPRPMPSRTKDERREYLRAWRARGRKTCECGREATVKRTGAEGNICERCALLETRRERAEQRRAWSKSRYGYKFGGLQTHGFAVSEQV